MPGTSWKRNAVKVFALYEKMLNIPLEDVKAQMVREAV